MKSRNITLVDIAKAFYLGHKHYFPADNCLKYNYSTIRLIIGLNGNIITAYKIKKPKSYPRTDNKYTSRFYRWKKSLLLERESQKEMRAVI